MAKPLNQQKMIADANVKFYQGKIRSLRAKILALQNAKNSVMAHRVNLLKAISDSQSLFISDVLSVMPELAGKDIFALLDSADPNSPLYTKWLKYQPEIQVLQNQIAADETKIEASQEAEATVGAEMQTGFAEYQEFFNETDPSLDIESPQNFYTTLMAEEILPTSEQDSLLADMSDVTGMELVSPEAQALVTLNNVSPETQKAESRKKLLKWAAIGGGLYLLFS